MLFGTARAGIIVRTKTNGRVWQTNVNPSEPLAWPWTTGADSAVLTITNLCTGAVTTETAARTANALFGSYALSRPETPAEQIYDIVLRQYAGEVIKSTDSARIAYIPGVNGGGVTVRANTESGMRKSEKNAVFAYDAVWSSSTATAEVASVIWTPEGGSGNTKTLSGTSGYDVLSLNKAVKTALELEFDGVSAWLSPLIRYDAPGTLMMYR